MPSTRTIGGLSTFRCKSLALSFTQARNSLSIFQFLVMAKEPFPDFELFLKCFGRGTIETDLESNAVSRQ